VKKPAKAKGSAAPGCAIIAVVALVIAIVGAAVSPKSSEPLSGGERAIADLLPKRELCRHNLAELQKLGVRVTDYDGSTTAEYPELAWDSLEHEDKIKQALLVFCAKMPDNGRYTVMIHGIHNGKRLASVVDGNFFDGD